VTVEETIDGLYGLPPADFTRARDEAAGELRRAGRREDAERVKALRKPTAAAAAANRLVRGHRSEVERFLRAAAVLRDALVAGKGDAAAATRQEREQLELLIRIGGETVRRTLVAAAVDEEAARRLLEARLERELEPGGFGTLLAHARPGAGRPAGAAAVRVQPAPPSRRKRPDDRAARAQLTEAKAALAAAEAEARQAERRRRRAQDELARARAAVAKAQRALDRLHGR
jgi:hypothetical protein